MLTLAAGLGLFVLLLLLLQLGHGAELLTAGVARSSKSLSCNYVSLLLLARVLVLLWHLNKAWGHEANFGQRKGWNVRNENRMREDTNGRQGETAGGLEERNKGC